MSASSSTSTRNMGKFEQVVTHVSSVKGPLKVTAAGLAAKTRETVAQQEYDNNNNNNNNDMTTPIAIRHAYINIAFNAQGSPGHTPFQSYSRQSSDRPEMAPPGSTPYHSRQSSSHDKALQSSLSFRNTTSPVSSSGGVSPGAGDGADWGLALARLRFLKDTRFALNEILTHEALYLAADLLASTSNDPTITGGQVRDGSSLTNPIWLYQPD